MTPEQSFILSLLSPMKTFPMVIPAHIGKESQNSFALSVKTATRRRFPLSPVRR